MSLDDVLSLLAIVLSPFSVISTIVLLRAANHRPRIGALTERAVIAAIIAMMVVSGAAITANRLAGYALFPVGVARIIFLASLVALAFVPFAWLALWLTGRLGDGGRG